MNKERLLKYCEDHEIWVPKSAKIEQIRAAIVRASLHKTTPKTKSCFGFWENENSTCSLCDLEKQCFKSAHGVEKEEYFKKLESAPRIRFEERKMRK